ncbi:MAG: 50S ribosomal protein L11 methyltransferase [Candidatus Kerfeldbacteria bacterium]|nr:50S ribosomal protein L11 methyltransferase [Candidatus Kerfeldbacteria bacterium]
MDIVWTTGLLVVLVVALTSAWAAVRAAPFVPTRGRDVSRMLRLAAIKPGEVVYDLGAGDGRFVIAAAKTYQARATGFEISLLPWLVAKIRIRLSGLGARAIVWRDFFAVDLSPADVVVCFLTPRAMTRLADQFRTQLRPGTRIISYAFSLPGWTPILKDKPTPKDISVHVYRV